MRHGEEVGVNFDLVKAEAKKAFGNDDIFMEKFLVEPKHIEVQVLARGGQRGPPVRAGLLSPAALSEGGGVYAGVLRAGECAPGPL